MNGRHDKDKFRIGGVAHEASVHDWQNATLRIGDLAREAVCTCT